MDLQVHLDLEAPLDLLEILVSQVNYDWSKEFDDDFIHQWIIKSEVIKSASPPQEHLGSKDLLVWIAVNIRFFFNLHTLCLRHCAFVCLSGIPGNPGQPGSKGTEAPAFLRPYELNMWAWFNKLRKQQQQQMSASGETGQAGRIINAGERS